MNVFNLVGIWMIIFASVVFLISGIGDKNNSPSEKTVYILSAFIATAITFLFIK